MEKMKRRRRFFEEEFKLELVNRFKSKQVSYLDIEKQYGISRMLFKVWVKRVNKQAAAAQEVTAVQPTFRQPLNAVVPIDMRLSQLIDALVEERIKSIVQQKMTMLQGPEALRTVQATIK